MWWKIVEPLSYGKSYRTLFHGCKGSRVLTRDTWLEADVKEVHDGTNGTRYMSGWHVLPTLEEAEVYHSKFKQRREGLIIVPVWTHKLWRKNHSRHSVYLAQWIYIGDFPSASEPERHNEEANHDRNVAPASLAGIEFIW